MNKNSQESGSHSLFSKIVKNQRIKSKIAGFLLSRMVFLVLFGAFPLTSQASMISWVEGLISNKADASQTVSTESKSNSQNMALLQAIPAFVPSVTQGSLQGIVLADNTALVPEIGPAGSVAEIDDVANTQISVYVVHKGDTLSGIAKMFGVSSNTIIVTNNLAGKAIHEGDQLIILPISGIQYAVKAGDTIQKIAKKYNADVTEIAQYNGLSANSKLTVGDTILVPGVDIPVAPTTSVPKKNSSGYPVYERYMGGGGPTYAGYYMSPIFGAHISQGLHGYNGIDLAAPMGSPVYAAASGEVIIAKFGGWNTGYGNYIVVSHPNGTETLYAHLSDIFVYPGATVTQGSKIASEGTSGNSTGPHLHFEVRGAHNPCADKGFCTN